MASSSLPQRTRRPGAHLLALGVALALFFFLLKAFALVEVHGGSMEPTLRDGETFVMKKTGEPERGDLVLFTMPDAWRIFNEGEAGRTLIKRILAGPGDELSFDGTTFFVNGEAALSLPAYECRLQRFKERLGPNQVFVVGDNSEVSLDSRRVLCRGSINYLVPLSSVKAHGTVAFHVS